MSPALAGRCFANETPGKHQGLTHSAEAHGSSLRQVPLSSSRGDIVNQRAFVLVPTVSPFLKQSRIVPSPEVLNSEKEALFRLRAVRELQGYPREERS